MSTDKHIWLPNAEVHVRVQDGEVTVWTDMTMTRKRVRQSMGFEQLKRNEDSDDDR